MTDLVENLSDGINTFGGERGVRLSGGQIQRIGIARGSACFIFDEATSALDRDTEMEVMRSKGERTVIIIAHRLSTIQNCDKIYRTDNGIIIKVKK